MRANNLTAAELCDEIRAAEDLTQLAYAYLTAHKALQSDDEVRAAYDYRKACLSNPISKYLGGG